jgi:hypothetical protein
MLLKQKQKKTEIAPGGNLVGIRCTSNNINIGFIFTYLVTLEKDKNFANFF